MTSSRLRANRHVVYSEWLKHKGTPVVGESVKGSTASDWALILLETSFPSRNEFKSQERKKSQKITGYIKQKDLVGGDVQVCAAVSGYQQGFLGFSTALICMSGSLFDVRPISLNRPLGKCQ